MKTRRIIQTGVCISLATIMLTVAGCKGKGEKGGEMTREEVMDRFFYDAEEVNTDGILNLQRGTLDNLITFEIEFQKYDESSKNGEELSNFAEIISIIPLETTSECLIGKIDKILHVDGVYYIVDEFNAKQIYAFDEEGKFITRIGGVGRGPGEYVVPCDIFYDSAKGEIVVWDEYQHQFTRFTKDGKFLGDQKISLWLGYCAYDDKSGLLWFTTMVSNDAGPVANYQLIALDSTYNNIVYRSDYNPFELNFTRGQDIHKKDGSLYYHPQVSDTIYEIKDGTITPMFAFNYKNAKTLPYNFREECKGDYGKFRDKYITFAQFWGPFAITDRYLIAKISYEANSYLAICDIENQSVRFINTRGFYGTPKLYDETSKKIALPDGMVIEGEQITLSIPPSQLKSYDNKEDPYYELSPYLSTQPKDDDNPLLVTIKFKDEAE